jgi:hypothetical protein
MGQEGNVYAVLWSHSRRSFQIRTLLDALGQGAEAYLFERPSDFVLVAMAATEDEAVHLRDQLEKSKERRPRTGAPQRTRQRSWNGRRREPDRKGVPKSSEVVEAQSEAPESVESEE